MALGSELDRVAHIARIIPYLALGAAVAVHAPRPTGPVRARRAAVRLAKLLLAVLGGLRLVRALRRVAARGHPLEPLLAVTRPGAHRSHWDVVVLSTRHPVGLVGRGVGDVVGRARDVGSGGILLRQGLPRRPVLVVELGLERLARSLGLGLGAEARRALILPSTRLGLGQQIFDSPAPLARRTLEHPRVVAVRIVAGFGGARLGGRTVRFGVASAPLGQPAWGTRTLGIALHFLL